MVVFDPFQPISCRSASNNLKLEALSSKIHPYGQKVDKLGIQSLVSWLSKNNKKNFSKSIRFFLVSSSNGLMMIFASMVPCDEIPLPLTLLERNPNNSIHSRYSFLTGNIHDRSCREFVNFRSPFLFILCDYACIVVSWSARALTSVHRLYKILSTIHMTRKSFTGDITTSPTANL